MAADKKYPYTTVPNNLRKLIKQLPSLGSPPKATQKWLEGIGFTGGNNRSLLPVLRHVGVIGSSGEPTDYWKALRSEDKVKFAKAVRDTYPDLFSTYPNADKQTTETLTTFFRTHTGLGEKAQSYCVRTFQVLVEFGEFEGPDVPSEAEEQDEKAGKPDKASAKKPDPAKEKRQAQPTQVPLALTVNLQIELPPSADGEVYDKLFAAMGKHLKGLITPPR